MRTKTNGRRFLGNSLLILPIALAAFTPQTTSAQATNFGYTGTEVTYTLGPGTYDITAYGAKGGFSTILSHYGGLGAEMEAIFSFTSPTTLTIMVGGTGGDGPGTPRGPGGGGGGTFVANASVPLIVAGGGGGGGYDNSAGTGGPGLTNNGGGGGLGGPGYSGAGGGGFTTDGGPGFWGSGQGYSFLHGGGADGGGFYGASGGGFGGGGGGGNYQGGGGGGYTGGYGGPGNSGGGGGGSYIDSSAFAIGTELTGTASPDGSHNGYVIIVAALPPTIQQQPASQIVSVGSTVSFSVGASGGTGTLSYQWALDGTTIPGATNSALTLTNVPLSQAGTYQVTVSALAGTATSAATLTVTDQKFYYGLTISGIVGGNYQIQYKTNVSDANWLVLTNIVLPSTPFTVFDTASGSSPGRVYRYALMQ